MRPMNRREFLVVPAQAAAASLLAAAEVQGKSRVGFVRSTHAKLSSPSSLEDPLDYARVREMVWKAIEYGKPRAGSLEAKIRPGSWVVIKPNIGYLRPQPNYSPGDITDLRVLKAVLEYVARKSRAGRITIAEGGTYRRIGDPETRPAVEQDGARVDATNFDWGTDEFPGFNGSIGGMLAEFAKAVPGKKFDYANISYDGVRDASGKLRKVPVPKARTGVGAFAPIPEYYFSNTIRSCDFLIDVPVAKCHLQCGVTACFKNYVSAAPREAYAGEGAWSNNTLHRDYSYGGRIDPFIADLAAFHPPDYNIVSGIRGLQYQEHNINRPDQLMRNNMVLAGEDTVAVDASAARLLGYNPWDIDYLHMCEARGLGTLDFGRIDVIGDELDRAVRPWSKPRNWYGRGNRVWRVTKDPSQSIAQWTRLTTRSDTLDFAEWAGAAPQGAKFAASVRVNAAGHTKALLWLGVSGRVTALLNGEKVLEEENRTRYRIGQFRKPVELKPGENLVVLQVEATANAAQVSLLLSGPRNDGDTVEGIRWTA